jgi:hypothetical protein
VTRETTGDDSVMLKKHLQVLGPRGYQAEMDGLWVFEFLRFADGPKNNGP